MIKVSVITTFCALFIALCVLPNRSMAKPYKIDYGDSKIIFSGTHAGDIFEGQFTSWQGDIDFDFDNPGRSTITLRFDLASAKTGNKMYDGTLPNKDWFNTDQYGRAVFKSTDIVKTNDDFGFEIKGILELKGQRREITFPAQITQDPLGEATASGNIEINRLDFNIGIESDPKAEWVSEMITIRFDIVARP